MVGLFRVSRLFVQAGVQSAIYTADDGDPSSPFPVNSTHATLTPASDS